MILLRQNLIGILEDVDDYDCEEYIRDQLSLVDKLKISKQKYDQAENYYNAGQVSISYW